MAQPIDQEAPPNPATSPQRVDAEAVVEPFSDFYRTHYRAVLGLIYTLSGSRTASEELAQDAFVRAHRQWDQLRDHGNREAWVKRVAINLARSWGRRRMVEAKAMAHLTRERPRIDEMPEPADKVWAAVRRLPGNQAAAIALRYHDDRSMDDIAEILGCSVGTVRVHLHRGRQALAAQLGLQPDELQQPEELKQPDSDGRDWQETENYP